MSELHIQHSEANGRGQFYLGAKVEPDAAMMYHRASSGGSVNIDHTEVSEALRGQDVGLKLQRRLVAWAREQGLKVSATCPFAVAMFDKHEELADVRVP